MLAAVDASVAMEAAAVEAASAAAAATEGCFAAERGALLRLVESQQATIDGLKAEHGRRLGDAEAALQRRQLTEAALRRKLGVAERRREAARASKQEEAELSAAALDALEVARIDASSAVRTTCFTG